MDEEDDDCVYVWGDDSDLDYTSTSSSDSEEDDGFEYYAQFSGIGRLLWPPRKWASLSR